MTYHYKRTSKNYKTYSNVTVYGANDKGNFVGRHTSHLKDNVLFKKTFFSKYALSGTPNKKLLGTHKFGNIDNLIKIQTKVIAPKITSDFNKTSYFKVTLKNKKTNKILKGVKINIKVTTANKFKNYVIKTNKKGVANFNTKVLKVGTHNVTISPANHKYIISGKTKIVIKAIKVKKPVKNSTSNVNNNTKNNSTHLTGDGNSSIAGDVNASVSGDANVSVSGDVNASVSCDADSSVSGDVGVNVSGDVNASVSGDANVNGSASSDVGDGTNGDNGAVESTNNNDNFIPETPSIEILLL